MLANTGVKTLSVVGGGNGIVVVIDGGGGGGGDDTLLWCGAGYSCKNCGTRWNLQNATTDAAL